MTYEAARAEMNRLRAWRAFARLNRRPLTRCFWEQYAEATEAMVAFEGWTRV